MTRTHPAAPRPWETWGSCASPPGGRGVSGHCRTKATDTRQSVQGVVTATLTNAGSPACWASAQPHAPFPSNAYGREQSEGPLSDSERAEGRTRLKLNTQKARSMASGPITSWQIGGETVETVTGFFFLGTKITADVDCSHEIKRRSLEESL